MAPVASGVMPLMGIWLPVLASGAWWPVVACLLLKVLRRSEPHVSGGGLLAIPKNKLEKALIFCRFGAGGHGLKASSSVHGEPEEDGRKAVWRQAPNLQQGSSEAAPGSESTAAFLQLLSKTAEGRPLPPSSSTAVLSGRRLKVKNNLQAAMPRRRPLSSSTVGSRRLAPSGSVPGGVVLGCTAKRRCGGDGAGPDGVFNFNSRVLGAKSLGLFVISYLFFGPPCTSHATV